MWTTNKSAMLSAVVTRIALVAVVAAAIAMPWLIGWYARVSYSQAIVVPIYLFSYALLTCGFFVALRLIRLLDNIKRGEIFVHANVVILRALSWYCFAVSLCCAGFGLLRPVVLVLSLAAAFIGLILRVVKNVMEAAVVLREENDGTI